MPGLVSVQYELVDGAQVLNPPLAAQATAADVSTGQWPLTAQHFPAPAASFVFCEYAALQLHAHTLEL